MIDSTIFEKLNTPDLLIESRTGDSRLLSNKYRIFFLPRWKYLIDDNFQILLGKKDDTSIESLLFEWVMDRDDQILWRAVQNDALTSNPNQEIMLRQKFLNANIPTLPDEQVESINEVDLHTASVYIVKSTYERQGWFGYRYRVLCFPMNDWKKDFFYCEHAIHTQDGNREPKETVGLTLGIFCGLINVYSTGLEYI